MKERYAFERRGTGLALLPDSYSVSFPPDGPSESAHSTADGAVCAVSADVCALVGCTRSVFVEIDGRRHTFCGRGHAALAAAGVVAGSDTCILTGCTLPVYVGSDGRRHPFCGWTHAEQWRLNQVAARAAADIAHWPEGGAHPNPTRILHPRAPSAPNPNPQNPKPQPPPKKPH